MSCLPQVAGVKSRHISVPMPLHTSKSIFNEQSGGFWFEECLRERCPVPSCGCEMIKGWEYVGTRIDARCQEKLAGQWWIYCPAWGYAEKAGGQSDE